MDKIKELNDDPNEDQPKETNTKITASKFKSVGGTTIVPKSIAA